MSNQDDSIVEQVAEAVVDTIANPGPMQLLKDLELAMKLIEEFKANLAGLHPSVTNIIKALF